MIETAILCLALNVYHESRGEPTQGQAAVAQVTMTRASNNPRNVCKVVFSPGQFSWTNELLNSDKATRKALSKKYMPNDEQAWIKAKNIATKAVNGKLSNIVGDSLFFYNHNQVNPHWKGVVKVAVIGNHAFFRKAKT